MLRLRRHLCSFVVLVFLLCAVAFLYFYLPDEPDWVLDVDEQIGGFASGGSHFYTFVPSQRGVHGPVRLRETRSGKQVASFLATGEKLVWPEHSASGRYLAAIVEPDKVVLVDFLDHRVSFLPAANVNGDYRLHFQEQMLQVRAAHVKLPDRNFLFELPSGKLFADPDSILEADLWSSDRYVMYSKKDGTYVWDAQAGRHLGDYVREASQIRFSPDGTRMTLAFDGDDKTPYRLELWDLRKHSRIAILPVELKPDVHYALPEFSADGRWLSTSHNHAQDGNVLETWDTATGKRLGRREFAEARRSWVSSPDSSSLAVVEPDLIAGEASLVRLTMLDMPAATVRWQLDFPRRSVRISFAGPWSGPWPDDPDAFRFSPDGSVITAFSRTNADLTLLDAGTGQWIKYVPMIDGQVTCFYLPRLQNAQDMKGYLASARLLESPSSFVSKFLGWLPGRRPDEVTLTIMWDAKTGEELVRFRTRPGESHLAPDGDFVLTEAYPDRGGVPCRLQGWPVPLWRPWAKIVGIPLGVVVFLFAVRWSRRHLSRAKG